MAELTANIDRAEVEATTAAFERLKLAIEAVNVELSKLDDVAHGGIRLTVIGEVVHCEIKPGVQVLGRITETIINPERM